MTVRQLGCVVRIGRFFTRSTFCIGLRLDFVDDCRGLQRQSLADLIDVLGDLSFSPIDQLVHQLHHRLYLIEAGQDLAPLLYQLLERLRIGDGAYNELRVLAPRHAREARWGRCRLGWRKLTST